MIYYGDLHKITGLSVGGNTVMILYENTPGGQRIIYSKEGIYMYYLDADGNRKRHVFKARDIADGTIAFRDSADTRMTVNEPFRSVLLESYPESRRTEALSTLQDNLLEIVDTYASGGISAIAPDSFNSCHGVRLLNLKNVRKIGNQSFNGSDSLTYVNISALSYDSVAQFNGSGVMTCYVHSDRLKSESDGFGHDHCIVVNYENEGTTGEWELQIITCAPKSLSCDRIRRIGGWILQTAKDLSSAYLWNLSGIATDAFGQCNRLNDIYIDNDTLESIPNEADDGHYNVIVTKGGERLVKVLPPCRRFVSDRLSSYEPDAMVSNSQISCVSVQNDYFDTYLDGKFVVSKAGDALAFAAKRGIVQSDVDWLGGMTSVSAISPNVFAFSQFSGTFANDNVLSVGNNAFYNSSVRDVFLPNAVSVSNSVFQSASNLRLVNLSSLKGIPASMFSVNGTNESLLSVNIDSAEYIGSSAFSKRIAISRLDGPNVTKLEANALVHMVGLSAVNLPKCATFGSGSFAHLYETAGDGSKTYRLRFMDLRGITAAQFRGLSARIGLYGSCCDNAFIRCADGIIDMNVAHPGNGNPHDITFDNSNGRFAAHDVLSVTVFTDEYASYTREIAAGERFTAGRVLKYALLGSSGSETVYPMMSMELAYDKSYDGFTVATGREFVYKTDAPVLDQSALPSGISALSVGDVVTGIGESAFAGSRDTLETIRYSPGFTGIGRLELSGCGKLREIDIAVLSSVGPSALYGCSSLTSLDCGRLTSIGTDAFRKTRIETVNLPNFQSADYTDAFGFDCISTTIEFADATVPLSSVFAGNIFIMRGGRDMLIPDHEITSNVYGYRQLSDIHAGTDNIDPENELVSVVKLDDKIDTLRKYCFARCNAVTSLHIPNVLSTERRAIYVLEKLGNDIDIRNLQYVQEGDFQTVRTTDLSAPSLTASNGWSFACMNYVSAVYMPSIARIGSGTFNSCPALKIVDFGNTMTTIPTLQGDSIFKPRRESDPNYGTSCYVPDGLYDDWLKQTNWAALADTRELTILRHSERKP